MKFIVGIDEVGRGPLAGPVTVGAAVCTKENYGKLKALKTLPKSGKDSKKLTPEEREKYSKVLKQLAKEKKIFYAVTHVSNKLIDSKGISFCIKLAMNQSIKKLKLNPKQCLVLLDGGLKAPKEFLKQKTIIKGDEKEKIISWASILAKVSRDELMVGFGKKYPKYGFEDHKGYGTLKHRRVIQKYGILWLHRATFCRSIKVG